MRYILTFLLFMCASYSVMAWDTKHTLEVGDTFASLEAMYDTCREAIIYENDLALKGVYSKYFFLEAGTQLDIPSKFFCDNLPTEAYYFVAEGDTVQSIFNKYRRQITYAGVYKHVHDDKKGFTQKHLKLDDELNVGDLLRISPLKYYLNVPQELYVIDQSTVFQPIEHTLRIGDTLDTLAEQYDTCREAIIWENRLITPRSVSIGFLRIEGDTLIIPPPNVCDGVPYGEYTITLDEPMSQIQVMHHYQQNWHYYFSVNEPLTNLLASETTLQVIPYIHEMVGTELDLIVQPEDIKGTTHHILQQGDSFDDLAERYTTCEEAILYANQNLKRTSYDDPSYQVKAGTVIEIPPASQCDSLPNDPIIYTVQEGDTLWGIAFQYKTWLYEIAVASRHSSEIQPSDNPDLLESLNLIEPRQILVIPEPVNQYRVRHHEYLLVYDDDNPIEYFSRHKLTLSEIARCYGVEISTVLDVNGLDINPYYAFAGGSLIIPNAQHNCVLHYSHPDSKIGRLACYPQPLEEIAGLSIDTTDRQIDPYWEEDDFCYYAHDVYDMLFSETTTPVVMYDAFIRSSYIEYGNSDVPRMSMDMISFCFRHEDTARDVTYEVYDASIVPPDDDLRVYALPPHVTCNQEMFDDYYVYRVRNYDTLSSIAKAYGTHSQLIAWANNLENPNVIRVGQYLLIPQPTLSQILQVVAVGIGVLFSVVGLRRLMRRQTGKAKRKPKEV